MKKIWQRILIILIILLGISSYSHAPVEKRSREKQKAVKTHAVGRFTINPRGYNEQRRLQLIENFEKENQP